MRFLHVLLLALCLPTVVTSPQAQACSFSWKKGWSPKEIKRRADVRKIEGTFTLNETLGERHTDEDGQMWIIDSKILGLIETRRGSRRNTIHEGPDDTTTCRYGSYFKPEANATGTFWLSRRMRNGRYQILHWEGEYLPTEVQTELKD